MRYYNSSISSRIRALSIFVLALFIALLITSNLIVIPFLEISDERAITVTVTDKQVKRNPSSGIDEYLIFCKDSSGEIIVLRNEDSFLKGKFNSSDFYGKIEIGSSYRFTICGKRIPFLSMYPNIIEIEKIHESE